MATIAASPADRKASERKFYTRMALFLVFLVLLGFGPSFYLRNIVPSYPRPNPTLPPAVILHGTVFTLWMALIVTQTFVPAAVGVALLGDGVRHGWWPAVAVGLVLSTSGAVLLGRQNSRVRGEALNDASR